MRSFFVLSSLAGLSSAHFLLNYPDSIGFDDDKEGTAPCGGFTPDFSGDLVDFHVGGEALAMKLLHSQGNWLFRVTLDETAESGWEEIFPIVQQSGLGNFCEPQVTLNESYVGKKGVVGVVSDAEDGLLYQCIVANFVSGSADPPSECTNSSSVKGSFTTDSKLTALVGDSSNDTDTSSAASGTTAATTASQTGTQTASTASSTQSGSAATALQPWSGMGLGNLAAVFSMALVGAALMI